MLLNYYYVIMRFSLSCGLPQGRFKLDGTAHHPVQTDINAVILYDGKI